jgi:hypothetical protein
LPFEDRALASTVDSVFTNEASEVALVQPRVRQNWVLDPLQDALLVIAAPLLALAAALALFRFAGAEQATALIVIAHIVFTVAHHLPTFIRIYGDVELFKRFKWTFLTAPVVPLLFSACVLGYINYQRYPIEYFLYLYIMLALWDPWHFLRQHYGFMRIYDRPNAAPRRLAARMDLALSIVWFAYIMLASGTWTADLLRDMQTSVRIPALSAFPEGAFATLVALARDVAIITTLVYAAYLVWCRRKGYYVSLAKVALCLTTFGVMYLAYTPNEWMLGIAPAWTFKVGFAVIGVVHVTQYLAIVWRYNRGLATRDGRARAGWFRKAHTHGGWVAGVAYVLICIAYGDLVTSERESRWLMSILLAIGFTSTLLHYYFDGFIWKLRHEQNRAPLAIVSGAGKGSRSWCSATRTRSATTMLARQLAYFGIPMAILTFGAVSVWSAPATTHLGHMMQAQSFAQRGELAAAGAEARRAFATMLDELVLARRLVELDPTAAHRAQLAFLIYNHSYYENVVMPQLDGRDATADALAAHRRASARAAEELTLALERGGTLQHPGRDTFERIGAERTIASWRRSASQE